MMTIVKDKNTTLAKEKVKLNGLKILIEKDKKNNDFKSLKYHEMALEDTKENIERLEKVGEEK